MVCWGSWANTLKLAGSKWRFEHYYFDFSFGVLLISVAAALTFGSMGDELSFFDNLMIAGKRQMAWAVLGGCVFNLANMLLVAAIGIAGMSVAFPIAIGLALIIGTFVNYLMQQTGNPYLIAAGVLLVLVAIVFDAMAYRAKAAHEVAGQTGNQRKQVPSSTFKGIAVSVISGVLMGMFYPLVIRSKAAGSEIGLGPYTITVMFAVGVFVSTFVYNLYFLNLPVYGEPAGFGGYFKGTLGQHFLGLAGGLTWGAGAVFNFVAGFATGPAQIGPAVSYALGQGATMISVLWGLLLWREFADAGKQAMLYIYLMLGLFAVGLALISIAPLH